jgi:transcriptional/translational regulatory protein YebC/TACO1
MVPQNTIKLEETKAEQVLKLMEMMEDNEDVQNVFANFDIPDEVMERLG